MEQINIKVSDAASKQAFMDLIENWRNGDESNGDVFNRIVAVAAATGQKPIEVSQHLGIVRNTVDTLMHQINSCVSANLTTISDLKTQLSEKDEKIEELDNDYKKKLLQMGDEHREKVEKLKTKIDELKDWLRVATEQQAKLEQERKGDADALASYRESVADKKAMLEKTKNDLDERNSKLVDLQKLVDQSEEKLASELRKVAEKHQAEIARIEKRHQFELEQERMQVAAELEKTKAEKDAERSKAVADKQEELYKQFGEERKDLQSKLDNARTETQKKQELLDSLKDQLAAMRENNAVLKQQLSQFTQQG